MFIYLKLSVIHLRWSCLELIQSLVSMQLFLISQSHKEINLTLISCIWMVVNPLLITRWMNQSSFKFSRIVGRLFDFSAIWAHWLGGILYSFRIHLVIARMNVKQVSLVLKFKVQNKRWVSWLVEQKVMYRLRSLSKQFSAIYWTIFLDKFWMSWDRFWWSGHRWRDLNAWWQKRDFWRISLAIYSNFRMPTIPSRLTILFGE